MLAWLRTCVAGRSGNLQVASAVAPPGGAGDGRAEIEDRSLAVPEGTLDIEVRPERHRVVLAPRGSLDHFTAVELRRVIEETAASGWRDVVLDLRGLDFMDSGGVHVLTDVRDGRYGDAQYQMVDGNTVVHLPLVLLGEPRVLPPADPGL